MVAVMLTATMSLVGGGCESLSSLGGGEKQPEPIKIRHVVVERAPFYSRFPSNSSIAFIYLTRGTAVQWLKLKDGQSKVKLADGSSGWVPTAALGETSTGLAGDLAAPESQVAEEARRDSSSEAVRFDNNDALHPFNRTTGVW
jgi:SH3-like domain-containing protein